jgi:hypothetical protein
MDADAWLGAIRHVPSRFGSEPRMLDGTQVHLRQLTFTYWAYVVGPADITHYK